MTSAFIFLIFVWAGFIYGIYSNKHKADFKNYSKIERLKLAFIITAGLFGWFLLVYVLSLKNFFPKMPLLAPNIMLGFLFLFIILKYVYNSKTVSAIVDGVPAHWLIAVQTYRIVGYVFFNLYSMGLLPAIFAFPAGIGDMIVGLSAPIVATLYLLKKHYAARLAIIWNIVGIVDLVVAIAVGILAYPRPVQILPTAVSTNIMSLYPMAFIPLFAVPLSLMLHLFLRRKIINRDTRNIALNLKQKMGGEAV